MVRTFRRRRRKLVRRKRRVPRPRKIPKGLIRLDQTVTYKSTVQDVDPQLPAESQSFSLSKLPRYKEFVDMFDAYRIAGVTLTWAFQTFPPPGAGASANAGFTLLIREDKDGDTLLQPATALSMRASGRTRYKVIDGNKLTHTKKFAPTPLTLLYTGLVTPSGYARMSNRKWIGTVSPDVLFYGVDWAFTSAIGTNFLTHPIDYQVRVTYHLEFKEVIDRVP
jgi:hypothetical protein